MTWRPFGLLFPSGDAATGGAGPGCSFGTLPGAGWAAEILWAAN
jgi:hypothetical protein